MKKAKKSLYLLGTLCSIFSITFLKSYGQFTFESPQLKDSTIVFAEVSFMGSSSERTPFWLKTNQFGIISPTAPAGMLRGMIQTYRPLNNGRPNSPWRIGGSIEAVAGVSSQTKLLLPQLHVSLRYKNWEIFAGRKKQWVGLADSTLGSGSYSWSGNAMPIPKIQIGTIGFTSIPLTQNWLSFNAFYSEGLFENNRPITSQLKLHHKMLYLRLGRASSRVKLYGGFNHQVQWGGRSTYQTLEGKMPTGLKNYYRIITGKPGDASPVPNTFDDGNRVGNHLGTIDFGVEIESHSASIFIYRQNIYEDGSLYALGNIKDGLNGIRLRRKNAYGSWFEISEGVFEFLYTKSQGGPEFDVVKYVENRGNFGKDNYFNNVQIRDGWSYFDRTVGTPFISPTSDTDFRWPRYADFFTSNNRVSAFHLGLRGFLFHDIAWMSKISYSTNIGTYDSPFASTARQFSGILSLLYKTPFMGGSSIFGAFATDTGQLYKKSFGFSMGLRKDLMQDHNTLSKYR